MHTAVSTTSARDALFERFHDRIVVNYDLSRSLVSFQANKAEPFYSWFKYKEGFSSALVRYCLDKVASKPGYLLDPFAGSGAALFAARDIGWKTVGIELLPVGIFAMHARRSSERVDPACFQQEVSKAVRVAFASRTHGRNSFRHISITQGAFSAETEREIARYLSYCEGELEDQDIANLFRFACFCVLEDVSFTRKDGQYLRWDHRSPRRSLAGHFDKGRIPPFTEAITEKLTVMANDIAAMRLNCPDSRRRRGCPDIRQGSCLELLPRFKPDLMDVVFTSPPYCNRYDYTRTYALELAFLGYDGDEVKDLRQTLLSCTVENKEKTEGVRAAYGKLNQLDRFEGAERAFYSCAALQEILSILEDFRESGKLNNPNIVRMVRNYFYEMSFVVLEIARILRAGGHVVMVNDNVRYGGEEVPVDLILGDFAEKCGLKVRQIWTLPRGKGNSSQQMGNHGRQELRKCVYIWDKPA